MAAWQLPSLSQHVPDCSYWPSRFSHAVWQAAAVLAFCQQGPAGPYDARAGPSSEGAAAARHASRSAQVESGDTPEASPPLLPVEASLAASPGPVPPLPLPLPLPLPPSDIGEPAHHAAACCVAAVQSSQLAQENTVPSLV